MRRLTALALAAASAAVLQACSSQSQVRGKVIPGDRSFIGVVDAEDPRLKGEGVQGVDVAIFSDSGPSAGAPIGRGASNAKGEFSIGVSNQQALIYPAQFRASKAGHIDVRQVMPVPPSDRRVLIILRPGAPGAN